MSLSSLSPAGVVLLIFAIEILVLLVNLLVSPLIDLLQRKIAERAHKTRKPCCPRPEDVSWAKWANKQEKEIKK